MSNLDDLTIGKARELARMFSNPQTCNDSLWEIGKIYCIRTVTMIDTGRLIKITSQELLLEDAAWIADTGRFADAIAKAEFGEVEPFPDGKPLIVGRGAIIDAVEIIKTQRSQK